jgi:hypothetical protein
MFHVPKCIDKVKEIVGGGLEVVLYRNAGVQCKTAALLPLELIPLHASLDLPQPTLPAASSIFFFFFYPLELSSLPLSCPAQLIPSAVIYTLWDILTQRSN